MLFYSLVEPTLKALGVEPQAVQIAHIDSLLGRYYPNLSIDRPALIGPLTQAPQYRRLGDLLRLAYPIDHTVHVISQASSAATPSIATLALKELATASSDSASCLLYIPQVSYTGAVETFQDTVAHLRAPDGCPWDRKQTHSSLRQSFLEEVYEVLDALDRQDLESLREELGDVLLQVLMHVQIASETGEFQMGDVVQHIQAKIVRRHPHVFAGLTVNGVDEVLFNWEVIKQQEKGTEAKRSLLDSVSRAMPSLARTQSIQRHVDWLDGIDVNPDKLIAQISSTATTLQSQHDHTQRHVLLGDLLFAIGNLARQWDIDAESALRDANNRFEQQFRRWEAEHTKDKAISPDITLR